MPDIASAQLVVADADHAGAVEALLVAARVADTVFIGARAPKAPRRWLPRPIDALQVLREIEALARRRRRLPQGRPDRTPPTAGSGADARAGFEPLESPRMRRKARRAARASFSALLVDDSAIALRYLQLRLQAWAWTATWRRAAPAHWSCWRSAPTASSSSTWNWANGSALDGLALCQHIKRQHRHVGGRTPCWCWCRPHDAEVDRARGAFAGCDHYLAKPADDAGTAAAARRSTGAQAPRLSSARSTEQQRGRDDQRAAQPAAAG